MRTYCQVCGYLTERCECVPGQVDAFAPPPPTGPKAEEYTQDDGRPAAFTTLLESKEGEVFWAAMQVAALEALSRGEERFSTRTFLASYRDSERVRINDHFSPWFADMLVEKHPELLDIVERRARRKVGPTPTGDPHPRGKER